MKLNSECGECGSKQKWLLHLRHRGNYRRLCTSCVLKHHSGSFCPHCFDIYEGFTPPVNRVICLNCDSPSHLACVSKNVVTRYLCPSCLNPGHVYFDVGELNLKNIDTKLSKILLTATQFASVSMKKAASAATVEADKRENEAWLTRKRAIEALQDVYTLAFKKLKKDAKESILSIPSPVAAEVPKGNSAVAAAVVAQKRIQNKASMALIEGNDCSYKLKVSPTSVMGGHQQFRNAVLVNGKDKSLNVSQLRISDAKVENEVLLQHPQVNHPIKEDPDQLKDASQLK